MNSLGRSILCIAIALTVSTGILRANTISYNFSGVTTEFSVTGGAGSVIASSGITPGTPFAGQLSYSTFGGPAQWEIRIENLTIAGVNAHAFQFNDLPIEITPALPAIATFYRDKTSSNLDYNGQFFSTPLTSFDISLVQGGVINSDSNNNVSPFEQYLGVAWQGTIQQIGISIDGVAVPDGGSTGLMVSFASFLLLGMAGGRHGLRARMSPHSHVVG